MRNKITKEEAIFCEKSYIGETDCRDCNYYGMNTCKSKESHKIAIEALKQKQKTGRWVFVDKAHEHARCSECGYGNVDLLDGRPHNYCPNCGSFMMDNERTLDYADQNTMMSAT